MAKVELRLCATDPSIYTFQVPKNVCILQNRSINDDFPALAEYLPKNYVKELYQDDAVNVTLVPQKNTFLAQTPPFATVRNST